MRRTQVTLHRTRTHRGHPSDHSPANATRRFLCAAAEAGGIAHPPTIIAARAGLAAWLAGATIALAGCAGVVDGRPTPAAPAPPPGPTVAVAGLDGLLLTVDEMRPLTASGVIGEKRKSEPLEDSESIAEKACAAIDNVAQSTIYAGSGWTAVRRQAFSEPGDGHDHYINQAVVAFPAARDAVEFFAAAVQLWTGCADRRYRATERDKPDLIWTVGALSNADDILSTTKTQEGADGWNCQRALTAANNVVIDVVACSYDQSQTAAVDIARRISMKVSKK